jgi:L,D-peptidoglycan transpeptidase YkuD (ErfK/YbiS/YcfS/YnhG family)
MKRWLCFIILCSLGTPLFCFNLNQHNQMVLVIADDWGSSEAKMSVYKRKDHHSEWEIEKEPLDAKLSPKGLAWGRGLHPNKKLIGPRKREEDKRTPAGIFAIGPIVGKRVKVELTPLEMPYIHLSESILAVNDILSPYYNQIVDSRYVEKNWNSSVNLSNALCLKWGAIIEYNLHPSISREGSSTFLLENTGEPSMLDFAFVALAYKDLEETIYCLRQVDKPLIVLLTKQDYLKFKNAWHLPNLEWIK